MDEVRLSTLKWMAESPAHYRHVKEHGIETTRAMRIGTAVHRSVLGGTPVQVFDGQRRGKAWDEFRVMHAGEEILTAGEYDTARAIADAVKSDASAMAVFDGCSLETHIEWSFMGRRCSSTPDAYNARRVVELKVSATSNPRWFWRHMDRQHWDAQLSFYEMALASASAVDGLQSPARDLIIVAVEPKPPYPVTVLHLPNEARMMGRKKVVSWFELLLQCERENYWPAYADKPVRLAAPEWIAEQSDEEENSEDACESEDQENVAFG